MTNTYREYVGQIEELQKKAAAARRAESEAAIREIRRLIAEFNLTASEIGLADSSGESRPRANSKSRGRAGKRLRPLAKATGGRHAGASKNSKRDGRRVNPLAGRKVPAKYRGPNGELWSGRGRRPAWVIDALGSGGSIDDLLISQQASVA